MARAAVAIALSEEEARVLRTVLRTPSVSQQQALRARIVLRAAEGATNSPKRPNNNPLQERCTSSHSGSR
jgi:hypothetical protein